MTSLPFPRPRRHALASAHLFMVVLAMMLAPMSLVVTHSLVRATLTAGTNPAAARAHAFAQLPLSFIPNVGQFDPHVRFQAGGMGGTIVFTPEELVLALPTDSDSTKGTSPQSALVHMRFLGANPRPAVTSGAKLPGVVNFMQGKDQARWHSNVPTYDGLTYAQIYPGVDLRYEGTQGQLKSTYTVAPGANPAAIRWRYAEATSVRLNRLTGGVQVGLPGTTTPIVEFAPVSWQDIGGQRVPVESRYVLGADNSIAFALGSYNAAYPLTIDPVTAYRTFLGGAATDEAYDVAVDAAGNVYLVGRTISAGLPGFTGALNSNFDVFVAKFSPALDALTYGTYIGGSGQDDGIAIAVDGSGNAYITGNTASTGFPTTAGVVQTTNAGGMDAFVTKLGPTGALAYSSYFGGTLNDEGNDIAVDAAGNAYVVGSEISNSAPFAGNAGGSDAFVVGLNAGATATLFAPITRGGTSTDDGNGIALDATSIYIVGTTNSATGISTAGVVQTALTAGGASDTFVTKYPIGGGAPTYATYLGGNNNDTGYGIAVDGVGNAYVAGQTTSGNLVTLYPGGVTSFQAALSGSSDGFVTQLNATGSAVLYNTYLGGSNAETAYGIAVDGTNNVYVTGSTLSTDFPTSPAGALQPANAGSTDAFVTQFNTGSGNSLVYSTYLGGNTNEVGRGLTLRTDSATTPATKNVYIAGYTSSTAFPTTVANTPYQAANAGGGNDAFVVRVAIQQPQLNPDAATTNEDTPVVINVLANDTPLALLNPATVKVVAGSLLPVAVTPAPPYPAATPPGTLVVNADGTITFTPAADVNGSFAAFPVTFKYIACDTDGVCGDPATVTVTINPVNDAPAFAVGGNVTVVEDSAAYGPVAQATGITVAVPATAIDEAAQTLAFTLVPDKPGLFSVQPAIDTAGNLTFTPAPNANGTATVSVTLKDSGGTANGGVDTTAPQTFQIIITAVNDAPVAGAPPSFSTFEGKPVDVPVSGLNINDNADTQAPADTVAASPFPPASNLTIVTPPTNGTATIDLTNQKFVYLAGVNNGATADSFVVSVCDGGTPLPALCINQTVNIAITLVNDPPVAVADTYSTNEDTALNVTVAGPPAGVLGNDTDPNVPSALPLTANLVTNTTNGTLTLAPDGSFTYTPNANFYGTDTFTYFARNSGTTAAPGLDDPDSDPATVTITVVAVPDNPVALNDAYTTVEDTALKVTLPISSVLVNDSDVDCPGPTSAGCGVLTAAVQTGPTNGTLVLNPNGTFTYTPSANFNGTDTFTYIATSSADGATSAPATVTITVTAVNDAPVVSASAPLGGNVLVEDTSLTLLPITVTDVDNVAPATERITLSAQRGTIKLSTVAGLTFISGADGTAAMVFEGSLTNINAALAGVLYTPLPDANGQEQVSVTANDKGNSPLPPQETTINVVLTITPLNDAPVATNDAFTVLEDVLTRTVVLANDNDNKDIKTPAQVLPTATNVNGLDPASVKIVTPPANGTATVNTDGTISYLGNKDYVGTDSFTYTVCDVGVPLPAICTTPTTVNVTVAAVNDLPTATKGPDPVTVAEDSGAYSQPWGTAIAAGPANESGQQLTLTTTNSNNALFTQQPTVTLNGTTGILSFTSVANASGTATVTLVIKDSGGTANGGQDTITLTFVIIVTPVNDVPTARDDRLGVGFNTPTTLPVLSNDSTAPDGSEETLAITSIPTQPAHGTIVIANGGQSITFTPTTGYKGPDIFTYQVCDNGKTNGVADPKCATATVTLTIGIFKVYLPIITRVPQPDLVGSFTLTPTPKTPGEKTQVTVTVTNTGTLPASNFWVDFNIEPLNVPTGANVPWDENCKLNPCFGIAWFVSQEIAPGQSITLTSTSDSYVKNNTIWRGFFIRGTKNLYLVVDSWNRSPDGGIRDPNGAVVEFDETNNVFARTIDLSQKSDVPDAEDVAPAGEPQLNQLAPRSLKLPQ